MANVITGQIIAIGQKQTINPKNGQGNALIKREFVIRALRFNPQDGTPELSERNTPILELQGQDNANLLDNYKVGDCVKVEFTIEGRSVKYQDNTVRYFDSVRAYRLEKLHVQLPMAQQTTAQPTQNGQYQGPNAPTF